MSESAEALAANISSRRNVTIEITNITNNYCLVDPMVYLHCGNCHSPPQPTIRTQRSEVCNFSKTSSKATGAVGVLTYDLFKRHSNAAKERLALMFSVPFDYSAYKNWMAVGIFNVDKEVDKSLYDEMYYEDEKDFVRAKAEGSVLIYKGCNVDVMCTMSPMGRAIMKVEVWDKIFKRKGPKDSK